MKQAPPTLLVFIDGLGIGPSDETINPIYGGGCPHLFALLDRHAQAIDACLGVPGLPQSATGQTALLTGVNAAQAIGRHVEGFPGAALRKIIVEQNIFCHLRRHGLRSTFANGYYVADLEDVRRARRQSVTTVATLGALGTVRTQMDIENDRAVYQDLTRQSLREKGYAGPLVTPEQAAAHLVDITMAHDLTLFEYFRTDRAGHRGDPSATRDVLSLLDAFLGALTLGAAKRGYLMILTSDHGNVEDCRTRLHTLNAVPFVAFGEGADELQGRVASLTDITPLIVEHMTTG